MSVEMLRTERCELTIRPSCMSNATVSSHSGGNVLQMLTNAGRVLRKKEAFLLNGKTATNEKYEKIRFKLFKNSKIFKVNQPLSFTTLDHTNLSQTLSPSHYKIRILIHTVKLQILSKEQWPKRHITNTKLHNLSHLFIMFTQNQAFTTPSPVHNSPLNYTTQNNTHCTYFWFDISVKPRCGIKYGIALYLFSNNFLNKLKQTSMHNCPLS